MKDFRYGVHPDTLRKRYNISENVGTNPNNVQGTAQVLTVHTHTSCANTHVCTNTHRQYTHAHDTYTHYTYTIHTHTIHTHYTHTLYIYTLYTNTY